ncbi:MAG: beta-ketoacyl-ACP synthase II [Planctomycetes bacterium]|jgi:3-oxoacyl-[acyl-carrier-protein] synthase II|nr:beta-ketoacyl-ACP synthase II [Planctomycetota bacterium]
MTEAKRRVVITGLGALTPLACGASASFEAMLAAKSGVRVLDRWENQDWSTRIAGEVRNLTYIPEDHFSRKELKRQDWFSQVGVVAAREAWTDSGLTEGAFDPMRAGAILGTGIGGIQTILDYHEVLKEKGPRRVTPFFIPNTMANALAGNVAIEHGLKGACFLTSSACASSGHAIGMAMREIRDGRADVMMTGGAETTTNPLTMAGFMQLKALSTWNDRPEEASRPFDVERNGFVMGEGAGALVIEELEHAKARGATIYCELAGFGQTDDAGHITAPDPSGEMPSAAMRMAIQDGGLNADEIDYVNAHGTSTQMNDRIETLSLKMALGETAARQIAISSTKSMTGHLIGAAAAVEAVVTAFTLYRGVAHQTRNLENPDLEAGCDLDYIPDGPRESNFRAALSNSLGFGGHNVCLAFRKFD